MTRLAIIFSMFLAFNLNARTQMTEEDYANLNYEYLNLENEKFDIEQLVFEDIYSITSKVKVEDVVVIELEEEVNINFDTKKHLPERFNAFKGMHDIDWNTVELVEIEEDVDLGCHSKNQLPTINTKSNSEAIIVSRY